MQKSITISRTVEGSMDAVSHMIEENPGRLLSVATQAAADAANDVVVHLEGGWRWFDVNESVEARVGSFERSGPMARLPLSWKADKHKRLLPNLDGHLSLYSLSKQHTEISYTAIYAPPFGLFGGLEDFLLGRRVLEAVLGRMLDQLTASIEEQLVVRQPAQV